MTSHSHVRCKEIQARTCYGPLSSSVKPYLHTMSMCVFYPRWGRLSREAGSFLQGYLRTRAILPQWTSTIFPCHPSTRQCKHHISRSGLSSETAPPYDPTVGICLGSYGGPREVGGFL